MRFFSNENKDSDDDQKGVDVRERADAGTAEPASERHPERVQSDPVAVPQQRGGSPWSSAPETAADPDSAAGDRPEGRDGVPFHEPGPQPTAFGASTVGGAVAASATANPGNDGLRGSDRASAGSSGVGDDRSVAPGDGAVTGDPDRADGDDRTGDNRTGNDRTGDDRTGDDQPVAGARPAERSAADDPVDVALDDRGTFDDPQVTGETPAEENRAEDTTTPPDTSLAGSTASDRAPGDAALRDEGGFDDPKAVDPATDQPLATSAAAAQAGAAKPGEVSPAGAGSLFDGADAQAFRDRWRDVQLRFVDSPKEATAEAAGLVDEVVDKLAAGLRAQKARLAEGGGDSDTERLRVELRGYRDLVDRILEL